VIRSRLVGVRILVAGGDPTARDAVSRAVAAAGYEAPVDGQAPDLALVIGGGPPVAGVPSVSVLEPGEDLHARMEDALAAGADAVLLAPVTEASLRREVERQASHAAARRGATTARRCADAIVEIERLLSAGEPLKAALALAADVVGADSAVCVFESDAPWTVDERSPTPMQPIDAERSESRAAISRGGVVLVGDVAAAGVTAPPLPSSAGPRAGSVVFPVEWRGRSRGALIFRRVAGSPLPGRLELDEHEVAFARILAGIFGPVNDATEGTVQADVLDRTDRIQIARQGKGERRLRAIERFSSYFDASADSIIALDGEARVLFVNRAAEALTGFARAALVGKPLTDLVPAEATILLEPVLRGVVGGSNLEPFDLPIHTTSGDRLWVSVSTSTVLAEHGVACLSFRDVTAERRLEAELRKTKEFLEKLIDSTVDAIIAADIEGKIILYNPGAERVFGWKPEDVIGRMSVERLYPDGVARQIMRMLRSPSYGGVGRLELTRREILTNTGDVVPVNMTASMIYEEGREVASVGILSDLRERIRIEQRLLMAQEKLLVTEKQAVVAELAGTAAHELNQPLTSVTLYVEMMLRRMAPDDVNQRAVQAIAREVARMAEIVKKIGRITRYETKQYVGGAAILDLEKSSPEESAAVEPGTSPAEPEPSS
jgi:PAS domain S-box-containing protein